MQILTKNFCRVVILVLAAGALAGCAKPSSSRRSAAESAQAQTVLSQSGGGVMENRSRIVATVLEVTPQETPGFYVRLRIDAAEATPGYASFAKIGEEINAYPNFVRQEGRAVDYAAEKNKSLLQAGTLQPGDQIVAEVYYRGGQGRESAWLLMSWQRKP